MKIRFVLDIANRRRNQVANVDDETAEFLIARQIAQPADEPAPAEETDPAEASSKPRRR